MVSSSVELNMHHKNAIACIINALRRACECVQEWHIKTQALVADI